MNHEASKTRHQCIAFGARLNVNLICEEIRELEMWDLWSRVKASAEEDKKEKLRNKSKKTSQTWTKS